MNVIIVTDATPDEIAALLESMKKQKEITPTQTDSAVKTSSCGISHICGVSTGVETVQR